jgi:hypothetical protein
VSEIRDDYHTRMYSIICLPRLLFPAAPCANQLHRLKDSDVTWLYGPLHTAVDWTPPPKPSPVPNSIDQNNSAHDRLDLSHGGKKPILKHRSISELLTSDLPSPLFSPAVSDDEEPSSPHKNGLGVIQEGDEPDESQPAKKRPPLLHTKSDTHITRWAKDRPFRKSSPPRFIASDVSLESGSSSGSNFSGSSTSHLFSRSGESDATAVAVNGGKKKHISFNTFVEQCIAIEKPKSRRSRDRGVDNGNHGTENGTHPTTDDAHGDTWIEDDGLVPPSSDVNLSNGSPL